MQKLIPIVVHGSDVGGHARHYLTGLPGWNIRKSIGRIGKDLPASNYQGLQQFISDSPWDGRALMSQVRAEAEAVLGRRRDTALYLDETSFVKKGEASVGGSASIADAWASGTTARWECSPAWGGASAPPWWISGCSCRRVGRRTRNGAGRPKCRKPSGSIKPKRGWPWPWSGRRGPKV